MSSGTAPADSAADRRLHPLDVAAVIGAEDVDQQVEAALDLVVVIGDVGAK
jgi:hypothetical protein